MKKRRNSKMIQLTVFETKSKVIESFHGPMRWDDWCAAEVDRLISHGRWAEIKHNEGYEIAIFVDEIGQTGLIH
jgi:hypothetical protein